MMSVTRPWVGAVSLLLCLGCSSGGEEIVAVDGGRPAETEDSGVLLSATDIGPASDAATMVDGGNIEDTGGRTDQGPAEMDMGMTDTGPSGPPPFCEGLGLPERPFQPGDSTYAFGDVAGDFTVTTLGGGSWRLQDEWTGCESYIFVSYYPIERPSPLAPPTVTEQLWSSPVDALIATPVNAHYFFMSWEPNFNDRPARVGTIRDRIETALQASNLSPEQLARQRRRFHYVTDVPTSIQGSVGAFLDDYLRYYSNPASRVDLGSRGQATPPFPFAFAIDRAQSWDSVGSLAESVQGRWRMRMLSYLPGFFDHKAAIEARLASEMGVETFPLLDGPVTDRIFVRTATLPPSSRMLAFDTLEVEVQVICRERNVFACSEWDRIAQVEVCLDAECTTRRELVRWITPYWRRGERRWIMDASSLLGLIENGGLQRFRIAMGPGWERKTRRDVRVVLRLSNQGKGVRATGAVRAFTGGRFEVTEANNYNDRAPFSFTSPASARRVELVLILSGHGDASGSRCAEWCDHRHTFTVNGTALPEVAHVGTIGSIGGCGPAASEGASPGQYGNWAPERAYWCPGLPVAHRRIDITSLVTPGQPSTLDYSASFRADLPPAGGNISLSAYIVWFE